MIIPRYANTGVLCASGTCLAPTEAERRKDCGSATHGTIRRHHSWGVLTPISFTALQHCFFALKMLKSKLSKTKNNDPQEVSSWHLPDLILKLCFRTATSSASDHRATVCTRSLSRGEMKPDRIRLCRHGPQKRCRSLPP